MTTHRWARRFKNPDDLCRNLSQIGAVVRWDTDPNCITSFLGDCRFEVFDTPSPFLLISGPTEIAVRDAVDQLGYDHLNAKIIPIETRILRHKHNNKATVGAR